MRGTETKSRAPPTHRSTAKRSIKGPAEGRSASRCLSNWTTLHFGGPPQSVIKPPERRKQVPAQTGEREVDGGSHTHVRTRHTDTNTHSRTLGPAAGLVSSSLSSLSGTHSSLSPYLGLTCRAVPPSWHQPWPVPQPCPSRPTPTLLPKATGPPPSLEVCFISSPTGQPGDSVNS